MITETTELNGDIDDQVGVITLNRPEKRNALSPRLLFDLYVTLSRWEAEDRIRAVIIKGAGGRAFSAGYDISAIPTDLSPEMAETLKEENPLALGIKAIRHYPYPVIAMMNGYAFGAGLNLAICCDMRIAADNIRVGMPPARLGVVYHPDGLQQFVRVLGMATTRELFLTARDYSGTELLSAGFVNQLVPAEALEKTVSAYARQVATGAPLSLKGMKKILNLLEETGELNESALQQSEAIVKDAFASKDLIEGQTAFLEKRRPVFTGK